MAMYHCSVKTISRSSGRSSVGASAYRAGDKLTNEYDGITHDYSKKSGVEYSEIMLPKNAPEEYRDRGKLWNAVEKSETRINSRTAREIEIALPTEFDRQEQIKTVRDYIQENFINKGMCADFSLHDKGDGNPHAHIMLTTREISPDGFTSKNRDWDKKESLEQWREQWAEVCNREFERKQIPERIDHRTLQAQGIEREPTIHLGTEATQMEKRGIASDRGDYNREVAARNQEYKKNLDDLQHLKHDLKEQPRAVEPKLPAADSPEQITERMDGLREQHLSLDRQVSEIIARNQKLHGHTNEIQRRYKSIADSVKKIDHAQTQIDRLQQERDGLGMFKGREKKELDEKIEIFKYTRDQAIGNLRRDFGIEPSQAAAEQQKLSQQARAVQQQLEKNNPILDTLRTKQQKVELAYKKENALTQLRPDKEKIESLLNGREEKTQSISERLKLGKLESNSKAADIAKKIGRSGHSR